MTLQPGVLIIAGAVAFALMVLPLGLPLWGRLLLIATMPAWLGPVVIRFRQRQPRSAEFALTPLDGSGSPVEVNSSFDGTQKALTSQGFVEVGRLRQTNGDRALGGFVQLLEHPETYAVCSRLIIADSASHNIRADVLVFVTDRTIGPLTVTSNSQTITPLPRNPRLDTLWYPDVRDPTRLSALHDARVSKPAPGTPRRTTVANDPVDYQRRLETAAKEHMVKSGYWWLDESDRVYHPTWKGAILMTLRSLPPWRQLVRWQRVR